MIDAEDAARFAWWFSDVVKPPNMLNEFLQGVREHWTLDQWRVHCDRWMVKCALPTQFQGQAPDRCDCSCAEMCPLGRMGSAARCTAKELRIELIRIRSLIHQLNSLGNQNDN